MAVCAEAVALGQAVDAAAKLGIDTIVAVRHPAPDENDRHIAVVSPCGACRELISDYDRECARHRAGRRAARSRSGSAN